MLIRRIPTSSTGTRSVPRLLPYSRSLIPISPPNQAMAIVQDRLNANKPPPAVPDPKKQVNTKDLDVDIKKEEPSFFGSFWSKAKGGAPAAKKGVATMDAVCQRFSLPFREGELTMAFQPPPVIRPQAALNERETMETEVISAFSLPFLSKSSPFYTNVIKRTPYSLLLQYREARDD